MIDAGGVILDGQETGVAPVGYPRSDPNQPFKCPWCGDEMIERAGEFPTCPSGDYKFSPGTGRGYYRSHGAARGETEAEIETDVDADAEATQETQQT